MLHFLEDRDNQNHIVVELTPFFMKYKKSAASIENVNELIQQVACVLDIWEYSSKEIKVLDRKAFFDLMKSYYNYLRDAEGKALFTKVFSL